MIDLTFSELPQLHPQAVEQVFSVGYCCQFLQVLPADLYAAMQGCGVQFVRRVDGVGYLAEKDLQAVSAALKSNRSAGGRGAAFANPSS